MKRILAVLFLVFALLQSGCAANPETGAVPEKVTPTPVPVQSLDEAELVRYEELFSVMLPTDGQMKINPLSCFLTSCYDSVENMDMAAFLRYFPGAEMGGEAEFEALRSMTGWPFASLPGLADMPVPLSRYAADNVRRVLESCAGLTLEDVDISPESGVYYLAQYDAFYNYTSDFGLFPPDFYKGERQGDTVRLWWKNSYEGERVLTLREADGSFTVVSFVRISE